MGILTGFYRASPRKMPVYAERLAKDAAEGQPRTAAWLRNPSQRAQIPEGAPSAGTLRQKFRLNDQMLFEAYANLRYLGDEHPKKAREGFAQIFDNQAKSFGELSATDFIRRSFWRIMSPGQATTVEPSFAKVQATKVGLYRELAAVMRDRSLPVNFESLYEALVRDRAMESETMGIQKKWNDEFGL